MPLTEWGVVGVLVVLVGLVVAIVTPIIKLNTIITRLSTVVEGVGKDLSELTAKNTKSHDRIWTELDKQDGELREHGDELKDHERRIGTLEHGK